MYLRFHVGLMNEPQTQSPTFNIPIFDVSQSANNTAAATLSSPSHSKAKHQDQKMIDRAIFESLQAKIDEEAAVRDVSFHKTNFNFQASS